jgi:hypothetical protein
MCFASSALAEKKKAKDKRLVTRLRLYWPLLATDALSKIVLSFACYLAGCLCKHIDLDYWKVFLTVSKGFLALRAEVFKLGIAI